MFNGRDTVLSHREMISITAGDCEPWPSAVMAAPAMKGEPDPDRFGDPVDLDVADARQTVRDHPRYHIWMRQQQHGGGLSR